MISSFCWFYLQHQYCDPKELGIVVPKTKTTHYRGMDIIFDLPKLPNKLKDSNRQERLTPEQGKKLKEYLEYFKPSKRISSIRRAIKSEPILLACPIEGCNHCRPYKMDYHFKIHLMYKHAKSIEEATQILERVKREQEINTIKRRAEVIRDCCRQAQQLQQQFSSNFHSSRLSDIIGEENDQSLSSRLPIPTYESMITEHPPPHVNEKDYLNRCFIVDVETTGTYYSFFFI